MNVSGNSSSSASKKHSVSAATLLINSGIPGYSYTFVDPDEQYQKYLVVVIQALSGTNPSNPPDLGATITDEGTSLTVQLPISPVFLNTNLMVHKNVSWMKARNEAEYNSKRQTRLGGLGPTIAQVKGNSPTTITPSIKWTIPLSERCDELIGSYSINNFPGDRNEYGQTFFPILMEFKLSTVEQNVKKETRINSCVWVDDSVSAQGGREPATSSTYQKTSSDGTWTYNK